MVDQTAASCSVQWVSCMSPILPLVVICVKKACLIIFLCAVVLLRYLTLQEPTLRVPACVALEMASTRARREESPHRSAQVGPRGIAAAGRCSCCAAQGRGSGRSRRVARLWFSPPERDSRAGEGKMKRPWVFGRV
eukprot:1642951-Pyramimonas_sp.AAC.1